MGKYKVRVGREFEIESVDTPSTELVAETAGAVSRLRDQKLRGRLALLIGLGSAVALATAAFVGFNDGSYDEVGMVWDAVALPLGAVLATYFVKH